MPSASCLCQGCDRKGRTIRRTRQFSEFHGAGAPAPSPGSTHNYFRRPHPQGREGIPRRPNAPRFHGPPRTARLSSWFSAPSWLYSGRCSGLFAALFRRSPDRPRFGEGIPCRCPTSAAPERPTHLRPGQGRERDGGRRRADRGAVDDQHRHRRRRRHGAPGRGARTAPAPRSCASRSTATRRPRPCRRSRSGCSRWASTCRSSATSTTSATSCSPTIPAAPRRSTSTASTPATSASRTRRTGSSPPSSRWRSSTTSRCASAPTGARSTRSCSPT